MVDILTVAEEVQSVLEAGQQGPAGPAGVGIPVGGTVGQVLQKNSTTDFDVAWSSGGGGAGGGDLSYVFAQMAPAATWIINHSLGKYPSVSVVDSAGNWVIGDVVYTNINSLTITFSSAFGGTAYLN